MIKVFDIETGKLKYQLAPKGEARDEVLEVSNFELLKDKRGFMCMIWRKVNF